MSVATPPAAPVRAATARPRGLARPEPGLAVLVFLPSRDVAVAGALLRPAPALALVADAAALEGQATAACAAGFELLAAEALPVAALTPRLRALPEAPTVLVTGTPSAGRTAHLARAAGAPVLALPPGVTAGRGPVVVSGGDARSCMIAVIRAAAADRVVVAGPPGGGREAARSLAERFGLRVEFMNTSARDAAPAIAAELDGLLAVGDHDRWRAPRTVAVELARGRPVLVVPARGGRR